MSHEDMFRLHLSGAGKYKGNELIVDDFTSVEFIDGMNEYIVYEYGNPLKQRIKTEYSYGKRNGKLTSYYRCGAVASVSHWVNDKLHGDYMVYDDNGSVCYRGSHTIEAENEP